MIDGQETWPDERALEKSFERIFGITPVGRVTATATRLENPARQLYSRPDSVTRGTGPWMFEFTDDVGIHRIQIITTDKIAQSGESAALFNGQYDNHYRSFGASFWRSANGGGPCRWRALASVADYGLGTVSCDGALDWVGPDAARSPSPEPCLALRI